MQKDARHCRPPYLAAPSWVRPGTVADNALFLENRIPEVELCFFECKSSLAYTGRDLPLWLATLNLAWHVHMPVDLCWNFGAEPVAAICKKLLDKIAWLSPACIVLHPPGDSKRDKQLLAKFSSIWLNTSSVPIFLENTATNDLLPLGVEFLHEHHFSICLDFGHALGYSQYGLLESELPGLARMVHWNSPDSGDRHGPLDMLSENDLNTARRLIRRIPPDITHVLEIFNWAGILSSLPVIHRLYAIALEEGAYI